ncbi:porin family protein [Pseudofulvibacter geojedonensis]|uniref:Porin family protein n=1 Tax=Pseudofulvibacter geojedonensis TaxID=1123758 RepID=A0ABW3I0K9_9FLAO
MKISKAILSLGILLSIQLGFSQENADNDRSSVGLKAGYNSSSVRTDSGSEANHKSGFYIGFFGESFVGKSISIQPELMYSQQGYEVETSSYTYTQKLNYINLPIMIKVYPVEGFYLELGPQIGYAISHKEEFDSSLINSSREFEPNSFTWGLNGGIGFVTKGGFGINARYHYGLGEVINDSNYFNNVLQIGVALHF